MRWTERRKRFRAIFEGTRCVHPASVYDPISARIAEDLGYEAGMLAGSTASLTVLGAPDLIVLTLTELADQALRIGRAAGLPLMIDADHGYGNALNVQRTVEELEAAGVAGLSIEDTDLPRPYGSGGETRLLPLDEGVGKMRAARAGRADPSLLIAGRTSALQVTGLDDTIARLTAYEKAGVDAVFVVGAKTREQVDAIADAVSVPLILGNAPGELRDLDYLSARGVRLCLLGHQPIRAAVQAVHDSLKALREGTDPADLPGVAGGDLMDRVTRAAGYERLTDECL